MSARIIFINGLNDQKTATVNLGDKGEIAINPGGSCNVYHALTLNGQNKEHLLLDPARAAHEVKTENIGLFFNEISEPNSHSKALRQCADIVNYFPNTPCLNHPERIQQLHSETLYQALAAIPKVVVPKRVCFTAKDTQSIEQAFAELGKSDFLLRDITPAGATPSPTRRFNGLTRHADLQNHLKADGKTYCLSEFIALQDANGITAKMRLVFVGNEVYLRHVLFNDDWRVTPDAAQFLQGNEQYRDLIQKITQRFPEHILPHLIPSLQQLKQAVGLDYFGIDCHIDAQYQITLFYISPNMDLLIPMGDSEAEQRLLRGMRASLERLILGRMVN